MFGLNKSDTPDALDLLRSDHKEVDGLFKDFEAAREDKKAAMRRGLVAQICDALTVHAKIEEEIFYPALRRNEDDAANLVDEATVEHQTVKALVVELESASPDDDLYDAKVKVLSEYAKHHVKEEEGEMFPLARKSDLDLETLGADLLARKEALAASPEDSAPPRQRTARNGAHKAPARGRSATKVAARKSAAHGGRH
jgi:hemerythrin superfamily protein